jgi:phage-related tail protein
MPRPLARLAVAGLLVGTLSVAMAAAPTYADPACDQATAAYNAAHADYVAARHKLDRAQRQLHHAHAHGTAAEFQQAKNKVRRVRAHVVETRTAMQEAQAAMAAAC